MRRRILILGVAAVALLVIVAGTVAAGSAKKRGGKLNPAVTLVPQDGGSRAGWLQYDNDVAQLQLGGTGVSGPRWWVGNQFNTDLAPGTPNLITSVAVFPAGVYGGNVAVAVFGPPAGSTAAPVGIAVLNPAVAGTWNTGAFSSPLDVGTGSFLVGMQQTTWDITSGSYPACVSNTAGAFQTTCEGIALGTGTTGGLGHHAMSIMWNGSSTVAGTGFHTLAGQNALVRVNGTAVPVELMRFQID